MDILNGKFILQREHVLMWAEMDYGFCVYAKLPDHTVAKIFYDREKVIGEGEGADSHAIVLIGWCLDQFLTLNPYELIQSRPGSEIPSGMLSAARLLLLRKEPEYFDGSREKELAYVRMFSENDE